MPDLTAMTTAAEWLDEARQKYAAGDLAAAEAAACIAAVTRNGEHYTHIGRWRADDLARIERERAEDRVALADRDEASVRRQVEAAVEIERQKQQMWDDVLSKSAAKAGEDR